MSHCEYRSPGAAGEPSVLPCHVAGGAGNHRAASLPWYVFSEDF